MAGSKKGAPKKKVKKDPNEPKKPKTSYFLFCDDMREQVSKELKEKNAAKVSQELGKRWKDIDPEEKKKYDEMYANAKKEYAKDFAEYKKNKKEESESESESEDEESDSGSKGKKKKKKTKAKDPNEPKRPLTAYLHFCNENRQKVKEQNPDKSMIDVTKILSAQWKSLSDEGKKKYNEMAAKNKAEYEKKMVEYKKGQAKPAPESKKRKHDEEEDEEEDEEDSEEESEEDE